MTEQSHLAKFAEFVISDDNSDLGIARAERDYALHCLEREIAICTDTRRLLWLIVNANNGFELEIEELQSFPGDDRARLTQFQDPVSGSLTLRAYVHAGQQRSGS